MTFEFLSRILGEHNTNEHFSHVFFFFAALFGTTNVVQKKKA